MKQVAVISLGGMSFLKGRRLLALVLLALPALAQQSELETHANLAFSLAQSEISRVYVQGLVGEPVVAVLDLHGLNAGITCTNTFSPVYSRPEIIAYRDSVTCLDSGGGGAPTHVLLSDGFENGSLAAGGWTAQNGNVSLMKNAARSGAKGVRMKQTTWVERAVNTTGFRWNDLGAKGNAPAHTNPYLGIIERNAGAGPFCTAKSGLACGTPQIQAFGIPSASATSGFYLIAGPARSCKSGILLYNTTRLAAGVSFRGGTLCVTPSQIRRGGPTNSGGTPGGASCDGEFALDMNVRDEWVDGARLRG
jgi:hypothetical protein